MSDTSDMDISDSDEEMNLTSARKKYTEAFASESPAVTPDPLTLAAADQTEAWMQYNAAQQPEQPSREEEDTDDWNYQAQQYDVEALMPLYRSFNGPLVEDLELPYLIDLVQDSDSSSREGSETSSELIEDLYGPFPTVSLNGLAMSPRDSPIVGSPRPSDNLVSKQLEIHKLKILIAEREKAKAKKQELEQQLVEESESSTQHLSAPPVAAAVSAAAGTSSLKTEQSELTRSIDAMSKRIDENSAQLEAAMEIDDEDAAESSDHDSGSDAGDSLASYFTAPLASADGTPAPASEIELQMEELQRAIEEHNARLKHLEKARNEARLKALGLQIRISATKNRKSKQSTAKASSADRDAPSGKSRRPVAHDSRPKVYPRKKVNGYTPSASLESEPRLARRDEAALPPPPPPPPAPPSPPPPPPPSQPRHQPHHSAKRAPDAPPRPHSHPTRSQPVPPPPRAPSKKAHTPSPPAEQQVHPIADAMKLATYLADVEELIKIRFLSDPQSKSATRGEIARKPPRPTRLVTVDDFTLALDSVLLRKSQSPARQSTDAPSPTSPGSPSSFPSLPPYKQETNENSIVFDSLLYNIIQRNDRTFHTLPSPVRNALESITGSLPADVREVQDPSSWGNVLFSEPLRLALEAAQANTDCELLWGLAAELSLYCHGPGDAFTHAIAYIEKSAPLAADVLWQKIREAGKEQSMVEAVLDDLSKRRLASQSPAETKALSAVTAEIIMRVLRFHGLDYVLYLLSGSHGPLIRSDTLDLFSLETTHLEDQDIYGVWMTVLYFRLFHQMPDSICRHWYASLLTNGRPSTSKPMFTIDWTMTAAQVALTRQEQLSSLNVLLSMLRHFSKKARSNAAKRPLLMGTWHTLLNLLTHCECYKRASTLALLRSGLETEALQPEIFDMAAYLETQMGDRAGAATRLQSYAKRLPMNHKLLLAYRSAHNLNLSVNSSHEDMHEAARLVGLPMTGVFDLSNVSLAPGNVRVDFVRRLYLSALGLDSTKPAPAKSAFKSRIVRNSAFAWINLMFLTQISIWLYSTHALHAMLVQQLENTRDWAMEAVKSDEAKLLIFKYASDLR